MPPGKLFPAAARDLDPLTAGLLVLETPDTDLVWWLGCESRTDFACLTTETPGTPMHITQASFPPA